MCSYATLLFFFIDLQACFLTQCSHVDILTIIIGRNPGTGIQATGPTIDVAFEKAAHRYPEIYQNITVYTIYKNNDISTCGETGDIMSATAGEVLKYRQGTKGFFLLLSPGCSLEIFSLGDMARELDVALIASTAADNRLADRHRYPTFVGFSSAGQSQMSSAIKLFLQRNNWRTVTLLCDIISAYAGAGAWYILTCAGFKIALTEKKQEFQVYHETFDSTSIIEKPDYEGMLKRAKKNCRVLILATNKNTTRRLMILASRLNMTSSDFVFLHPQAVHAPGVYDLDWRDFDADDHTAFESFNSVIKIQFRSPNWTMLQTIETEIAHQALTKYNFSFTNEEMNNELALSAYEAVLATSQLLNENWDDLPNMTGTEFSRKYLNNSFDFDFRTADISWYGLRLRNTEFCMFNDTSGNFEVVWERFWNDGSLKQLKSINWHGGLQLPPNEPGCGFSNSRCSEKSTNREQIVLACCLLTLLLLGFLIGKKCWDHQELPFRWWLLNPRALKEQKNAHFD